jgi:hypothetical protein
VFSQASQKGFIQRKERKWKNRASPGFIAWIEGILCTLGYKLIMPQQAITTEFVFTNICFINH